MKTLDLPFSVSDSVANLISVIERTAGVEVVLREGEFDRFDEPASVQGGFDNWVPHVTVNRSRRTEFDEHGLAHELLHIKRFLEGAPSLETPEAVASVVGRDAEVRKAFVSDVTNQIEHVAIFPQLVEIGFNPHKQADGWKQRQIEALRGGFQNTPGPVDFAWLAVKIGTSGFLGCSNAVQQEYRSTIHAVAPHVLVMGDEIAGFITRYGLAKAYNLRRLYQQVLYTAGVPKHALLLKELNFRTHTESLEPVP